MHNKCPTVVARQNDSRVMDQLQGPSLKPHCSLYRDSIARCLLRSIRGLPSLLSSEYASPSHNSRFIALWSGHSPNLSFKIQRHNKIPAYHRWSLRVQRQNVSSKRHVSMLQVRLSTPHNRPPFLLLTNIARRAQQGQQLRQRPTVLHQARLPGGLRQLRLEQRNSRKPRVQLGPGGHESSLRRPLRRRV